MKGRKRAQQQQNIGPLLMIGLGLLLLLTVALLLINRANQNQQAANPSSGNAAAVPAEVERVSLEDAKGAFDSQQAVFLDVRDPDTYNEGHIPGSVNIPLAQLESRLGELDPNRWIITYCT